MVDRLEAAGDLTYDTARLLHVALNDIRRSGPGVGDGLPGIKEAFEDAYDAAGGASFLGLPSAEAYEAGPGFVQHLRGARCGHPAVICAIAGREAVIITRDLWNGIAQIGRMRPNGGVLGVGLPIHAAGGDQRYIGPMADRIPTARGAWGPGTMVRTTDDRWSWVADLAFTPNTAGNAETAFDSQSALDLRLRLVASIPAAQAEPRLTAAGRRGLTAALAKPEKAAFLSTLAAGRVDVSAELQWRPRTDQYARNDSWGASYECSITAANGQPAIRGTVQIIMPDLRMPNVTSVVDVQFDFNGCQTAPCQPNTPVARPLSHTEIAACLSSAWTMAFGVLPLALNDSSTDEDAGDRPRVDLYVINQRSPNTGTERTFRLQDLVDLTGFGTTNKAHLTQLAIGVIGRGWLNEQDASDVVRQALVRAAEDAGFDAADLVTW